MKKYNRGYPGGATIMKAIILFAVLLTACGDDLEPKRETLPTNAVRTPYTLNKEHEGACHACNDNPDCYCWWQFEGSELNCVEVLEGSFDNQCEGK